MNQERNFKTVADKEGRMWNKGVALVRMIDGQELVTELVFPMENSVGDIVAGRNVPTKFIRPMAVLMVPQGNNYIGILQPWTTADNAFADSIDDALLVNPSLIVLIGEVAPDLEDKYKRKCLALTSGISVATDGEKQLILETSTVQQ